VTVAGIALPPLPPLPQVERLRQLAPLLWQREEVRALWLGGSLARGEADRYSDVDLRLAVAPDALDTWRQLDFDLLFEGGCVGSHFSLFDADLFLHHLALSSGDIVDLSVQSAARAPFRETVLILGCRDRAFERQLGNAEAALEVRAEPAGAAGVRGVIVDFWINSLKHRKILHRGLDLLALTGIEIERATLMRLWYVLATGFESAPGRDSIHGKTPVIRAVEGLLAAKAFELLGAPARHRAEIVQAIEGHRDEVSRVGRLLAERLGFAYPAALEETVRRTWHEFLAVEELPGAPGT